MEAKIFKCLRARDERLCRHPLHRTEQLPPRIPIIDPDAPTEKTSEEIQPNREISTNKDPAPIPDNRYVAKNRNRPSARSRNGPNNNRPNILKLTWSQPAWRKLYAIR